MGEVKKAKFSFEKYIIEDATIHVSNKKMDKTINFNFELKGLIDKDQKIFELTLETSIKDKAESFLIEISAVATFKYVEDENGDIPMPFLLHNAPAILFPYIRAYIANLSALSGIQTILLPTINMSGSAKELERNIKYKEKKPE